MAFAVEIPLTVARKDTSAIHALLHDQLGSNSFMQMIMIMPFD
jgi:hypothetical protein